MKARSDSFKKKAEKEHFFLLVNRLAESRDSAERQRLKKELARMTFGEGQAARGKSL